MWVFYIRLRSHNKGIDPVKKSNNFRKITKGDGHSISVLRDVPFMNTRLLTKTIVETGNEGGSLGDVIDVP